MHKKQEPWIKEPAPLMRTLLYVAVFVVTALCPVLSRSESAAPGLRIGFILPLSGDWAFLGNGIRNGALLAQTDLRSKNRKVTLLFEDNRGDVGASVTAAARLTNIEKVDAIVSIISGVAQALRPLALKSGVLSIGICSDTSAADGVFSYVNYLTAEQGAAKYIEHLLSTSGKVIGIYSLNETGFLAIIDELRRQGRGKLDVAYVELFEKGTSDFRPLILRRAKHRTDAMLILGLSPEIELLARQSRALGISSPFTSIEGFGLASDKTPFEESWFVDSAVPDTNFEGRYRSTYGIELTPGVGHAYDSVTLLAEAAAEGSLNAERFRTIRGFDGVIGKIDVRPSGVIWSAASVKIIRNGKAEILAR